MGKNMIIEFTRPDQLSALQRASEITTILDAAIIRTHRSAEQATDQNERQVGLGFSGHQRVHTNPYQPRSSK